MRTHQEQTIAWLNARRLKRIEAPDPDVWTRSPSPPRHSYGEGDSDEEMKRRYAPASERTRRQEVASSDESESKKKKEKRKEKRRKPSKGSDVSDASEEKKRNDSEERQNSPDRRRAEDMEEAVSLMQAVVDAQAKKTAEEEDKDIVGPKPLPKHDSAVSYGGRMLPGEADAIARFVKENKRIPRRGEIGLTSNQIEAFETAGYVMSGNRHKRMTAVRLRKEAQVYSAEEQKALAALGFEEKMAKETKVLAGFRLLVGQKKSGAQAGGPPSPPAAPPADPP